ncbi:hypothetical protein [Tunturiibacter gelidoferens]|uniref:Uncharacterized protein n=1 Tax=Tunturiibacter lichenicola TaxID=2051959 RepID=A0A7Y9T2V5_9BACT|nr:hypothetical protein [Edaphobacter lichenicola]NYF52138.1 hypothetical protein [Edaphobacter lichenicola]
MAHKFQKVIYYSTLKLRTVGFWKAFQASLWRLEHRLQLRSEDITLCGRNIMKKGLLFSIFTSMLIAVSFGQTFATPIQKPVGTPASSVNLTPSATQNIVNTPGTNTNFSSPTGWKHANLYPGTDAGAKINAAYADLPANGGIIFYQPAVGGEKFGTSIVFDNPHKPAILQCYGASGNGEETLTYTGSGTGILINTGPATVPSGPVGSGIRDCDFAASSSSATLLFLGGSNGAEGAVIRDSKFFGGALTMGIGNNTWHVLMSHLYLQGGVQQFATSGSINAGENIDIEGVVFGGGGFGVFANGVVFGGGASGPGLNLKCGSCSFDNTQLVVAGGQIKMDSTHFEDPGAIPWPTYPLVVRGGNLSLDTPSFFGNHKTAPLDAYISVTSGILITEAVDAFGCDCTYIYSSSGDGRIIGGPPLSLSGPSGSRVTLIHDTSSEKSVVDGGRNYAYHAESPTAVQGYYDFLPGGGVHVRDTATSQAGTGMYLRSSDLMSVTTPDLSGYTHAKFIGRNCDNTAYSSSIDFYTEKKTAANQSDTSTVAATIDCNKVLSVPAVVSGGSTFTIAGCGATSAIGGSTAGQFVSGATGTCSVTVTMGGNVKAPHGWVCPQPINISTGTSSWIETGFTTTTATFQGKTTPGQVIIFSCTGY